MKAKPCEYCAEVFEFDNPAKRFCSRRCQDRAKHQRPLPGTINSTVGCEHCGETFEREAAQPDRRFCSRRCTKNAAKRRSGARRGVRTHAVRVPVVKLCAHCEAQLEPSLTRSRYCSARCCADAKYLRQKASGLEALKLARRRAKYQSNPEYRDRKRAMNESVLRKRGIEPRMTGATASCLQCQTEFPGRKGKKFCSEACRIKARDERAKLKRCGVIRETILRTLVADTVRSVVVRVLDNGGAWVFCPSCSAWALVSDPEAPHRRKCCNCDLEFELNADEYDWVRSESSTDQQAS